jgi:hypothetical protein
MRKEEPQACIFLDRVSLFPKDGLKIIQDLDFDIKFE